MLPFSLFKSKSKGGGKGKGKEREKEKETKKLRASVQRRFEGRAREMEMEMARGYEHEQQDYGHEHGQEQERSYAREEEHDYRGARSRSRSPIPLSPSFPSSPTGGGATGQRTRSVSHSSVEGGRMGNVHSSHGRSESNGNGNGNGRAGGGHMVGIERSGSGRARERERESVLSYQPSGRGHQQKGNGRRDASPSPSMLVSGREGGGEKKVKEEKGKGKEREGGKREARAKEGRVVDEIRRLTHHPSITVVNVNERVSPCIFRVDAYGIWKQAQARMGVDEEEREKEDREWKTMKEAARAGVVGTTENVLRLAKFLAEEAESIVSMDVSARSMSVVASFRRDGWEQRLGVALGT